MKVLHEREKCIGCGSCVAICPEFWEMGEDGKSFLKKSKVNPATGKYELEIDEPACNKEAANSCPAQIISISK